MSEKILNDNINIECKASGKDDRIINYVATKESVLNESGRLFKVDGMDLSYLKKFKSIYYNHNTEQLPIGKAVSVRKQGDEVRIAVQFAEMEENGFADTLYKLVKNGYVNGGSIGVTANYKDIEFPEKPVKVNGKEVAMIVHKSALKEFSITPKPDNRAAVPLNAAIEAGVIDELEAKEFEMIYSASPETEENGEQINAEDEVSVLKARIAELELLVAEREMDEETEDSVYDELYAEFCDDVKNDSDEEDDSWMDEYLS
jgi:hypothetical protein